MGGINVGRWLAGGVAAGVLMWLMEGAGSMLYMADMEAAMKAHNLSLDMGPGMWISGAAVSLLAGLVQVFFYAAVRPRFGPGPRTAVMVAVALWLGGYLLSLIGYAMLGLFPVNLLCLWGLIGLVEMVLATLLGAWVYREA